LTPYRFASVQRYIKVEPLHDPILFYSRYADLLRRIGLSQQSLRMGGQKVCWLTGPKPKNRRWQRRVCGRRV